MFGNMKMLGVLSSLMQNREALEAAGKRIQEKAESMRVVGDAGGGAVRATVDGKMRVVTVEIAPALASSPDAAGDLGAFAADAVNAAQTAARNQLQDIVRAEARDLGLEDLLDQFGGDIGKLLR